MDPKVEIKGNVDVAIGQNHAPITVNYGGSGGGSDGGDDDEPKTKYVLFRDMTLEKLHQCRSDAKKHLAQAKKELYFSIPSISFAVHVIIFIAITSNFIEFLSLGNSTSPYIFVFVVSFITTIYLLAKTKIKYAPVIQQYDGEIAGIDNELLHRKIRRNKY